MDRFFYHAVSLDKDLCKGCTTCLQRCPTGAIRIRDEKARITDELCISCGECIRVCPHHAKLADHDDLASMNDFKYRVALPAPSLYTQFHNLDDPNIVLNALLSMGFDDVYEVSAAAELVSEASREYIETHKAEVDGPFISTACPTIVRLISIRFPNLLPQLLPLNPPIEVAAKLAVKKTLEKTGLDRDDIGIFFISPCPSKVAYARAPVTVEHSEVDRVIAIKDVYPLLLAHMKAVSRTNYEEINESGKIGISWSARGGEATGLLRDNYLAADGMENVMKVLEDLEDLKFQELDFVELNACNGGCVGGVLTVENAYVAEARLKKLRKYMPVTVSHLQENQRDMIPNTKEIEYVPVFNLGSNMLESFARLNKAERIEKTLPGLDCGICGAPSCKALAEDIAKGEASENDCIHFLRDKLHKITNELETMTDKVLDDPKMKSSDGMTIIREYIDGIKTDLASLDKKSDEKRAKG